MKKILKLLQSKPKQQYNIQIRDYTVINAVLFDVKQPGALEGILDSTRAPFISGENQNSQNDLWPIRYGSDPGKPLERLEPHMTSTTTTTKPHLILIQDEFSKGKNEGFYV